MIDVIIPVYNSHETIEYTLMSVAMQNIIDKIKVYIIDDNSNSDYNDIINKFSNFIDIKLLTLKENVGPAKTREYALKNSSSKYIIFLDSDDSFKNPESVNFLYNEINKGFDYVCSNVYYEKDDVEFCNNGDLHGKIYRRSFLIKNNIHFFDSRYHEDNAFNNLVLINNPKTKMINEVTYIYFNNENSLTNNPLQDEFERLEIYLQNMEKVIDKCKEDSCNITSIEEYINRKKIYLKKIYNNLDKSKQDIFNYWLNKYNLHEYICF